MNVMLGSRAGRTILTNSMRMAMSGRLVSVRGTSVQSASRKWSLRWRGACDHRRPSHHARVEAAGSGSSSSDRSQAIYHPVVYHPDFQISPLPDSHRFPMPKDHLLYLRLQELGMATAENTFQPTYPDEETLVLCHDRTYVRSFLSGSIAPEEMRKINLPWSEKLVRRTLVGTGSAITAARMALQAGVACMCNGGTHHAHGAHGSGWCIFNDQAVAARLMQQEGAVSQVLFIDLDVHQGDGTASIFADDPSVFTFSLHCHDQPFPAVRPPSDLDIGLPAGSGDEEYMKVVHETVPRLLDEVRPDIVFYNAGVDPHKEDKLGLLHLSNSGISQRDQAVIGACASRGVPVAAAIGGGYAEDHLSIVERHVSLHEAARDALEEHGPWGRVKLRRRRTAPVVVL